MHSHLMHTNKDTHTHTSHMSTKLHTLHELHIHLNFLRVVRSVICSQLADRPNQTVLYIFSQQDYTAVFIAIKEGKIAVVSPSHWFFWAVCFLKGHRLSRMCLVRTECWTFYVCLVLGEYVWDLETISGTEQPCLLFVSVAGTWILISGLFPQGWNDFWNAVFSNKVSIKKHFWFLQILNPNTNQKLWDIINFALPWMRFWIWGKDHLKPDALLTEPN